MMYMMANPLADSLTPGNLTGWRTQSLLEKLADAKLDISNTKKETATDLLNLPSSTTLKSGYCDDDPYIYLGLELIEIDQECE